MATTETGSSSGSPFWRFSLGFYRRPGVAEACIALQDAAGIDVNVLLFLLWCASEGRRLSPAEVGELDRACAPWRNAAVIPLRAVRRALKSPPPLIEAGAAEFYRTRIKAVELEAERLQQEALFRRFAAGPPGEPAPQPGVAARANLAAFGEVHDKPLDAAAVDKLLQAFATGQGESQA